MQIKYVEMQGFKSFPDKTRININPGMTIIVGPNGSGKSNISDAIRWVLGEMSSKNMRGTKMEDVIFGGCDSRRPMGFAEVSVAFDNTVGDNVVTSLPYDEICVTRKYYRSGSSEYMINRNPVRLRDITDLFLNTGLGKSGYSIIGQGRIAEIISKKSEDRRGIFEEAAGISRYRLKKNEAERKLAEVKINIQQAEILRNELESKLEPLEKQSVKAKKFVALRDEKKTVDIAVWLYEIANVKKKADEINEKCEISRHEYEIAADNVSSLETQSDTLSERARNISHQLDENRRLIIENTEKRHAREESASLLEAEISHIDENLQRLAKELDEIRTSGGKAANETQALNAIVGEAEEKVAKLRESFAEYERKLSDIRLKITENDIDIENHESDITKKSDELTNKRLSLSSFLTSSKDGEKRREEISLAISDEKSKLENAAKQESEIRISLAENDRVINEADEKLKVLNEKQEAFTSKHDTLENRKNTLKVEASSVLQRYETLKKMDEHFEGFAGGVKLVMEWSHSGALDGICGPVSKLISLDKKYAVAMESALGSSVQNVICENDRAAKKAIEKLKNEHGGIVTFYPLNTMHPSKLDIDRKRLTQSLGFIGFANELVSFDKHYSNVVDYLLCRTVICETLENAMEIGRQFNYLFKIVTLDGQIVNAGGSFTGGSRRQGSGILTRRAEIDELARSANEKDSEIKDIENELIKVNDSISLLSDDISEQESKKEISLALRMSAENQIALIDGKNSDTKANIQKLENELSGIANIEKERQKNIENTTNAIKSEESEIAALRTELDNLKKSRLENERSRSEIIDGKNATDTKISSALASLEYTKKEISSASATTYTLAVKEKENEAATALMTARKAEAKEEIAICRKDAEELKAEGEKLESEALASRSAADSFERDSALLRGQIKEKTVHRDNLYKILTRLEEQASAMEGDNDRYLTMLSDEYDMTYAEAIAYPHEELKENNRAANVSLQNKLKRQIKELGDVNVAAIDEYAETKQRFEILDKQYSDLMTASRDYSEIAGDMEKKMKTLFCDTFNKIQENFAIVFTELFGGGKGMLTLTDPENVLESGIEISVAPPGKIIKSLSLLSGGEQVFVAIALFFAILRVSPAPFCLLDEIEAALDEVNVIKFATYAKQHCDKTQFIIITHRRGTMEKADMLYGVVMQQRGISNILSIEVNEVESKLGLKDIK